MADTKGRSNAQSLFGVHQIPCDNQIRDLLDGEEAQCVFPVFFHTLLELLDDKYRLLRQNLPTRKTFFDNLRALTRYLLFESWNHLLTFMIEGLELELPPTPVGFS